MIDDVELQDGTGAAPGADALEEEEEEENLLAEGEIWSQDIDLGFAPTVSESVVATQIDGELVLVDPATETVHHLSKTGALLWSFFDGETTLGELSQDLADAAEMPSEEAEAQMLDMAEALGEASLLQGVVPVVVAPIGAPEGLGIGEEFPPTHLPTVDGGELDLADLRGREVFLINWSPRCGFCEGLAGELAELQPKMAERGVEMVFLSIGEPDENTELMDAHGLAAAVMLGDDEDEEFDDPFPGIGTPAAYLLDADGKVSARFAYGATEVPTLAREAAGLAARVELPIVSDAPSAPEDVELPEIPGVKYLPAASAEVCAPGAQGGKKSRVWSGTRAYAIGEYHVGIRADSAETHATIQAVFAAHRLPGGTPAPVNYSVVLGDHEGASRGLNLLMDRTTTVIRSRSARRVLYGLAAYLSRVLPLPDDGLLRTIELVGIHEGKALILPAFVLEDIEHVQPGLAKMGIAIADDPTADIDLERLELIVPEPRVQVDEAVIEALPHQGPWRTELARVEPGRYPLGGWYLSADPTDEHPPTRAEAIVQALQNVVSDPEKLPDQVQRFDDLFGRFRPTVLTFEDTKGFLDALKHALRS